MVKKFGDVYQGDDDMEGVSIRVEKLIDETFEIKAFELKEMTNYEGKCATVSIKYKKGLVHFRTSSNVLVEQLISIETELPVEATLRKVKNYYTFE